MSNKKHKTSKLFLLFVMTVGVVVGFYAEQHFGVVEKITAVFARL